jgi:DNA helicase-2/ATP-dependent DNA helicase PcrA
MRFLASLNPEQYAAVTAPPGPVLVRAGAGTGKTRVLTLRIAYLVEQRHATPAQVLALTFTNKAARELRARLTALLGGRVRGLTSGTFHAIGARILRAEIGGRLGNYTADFSIYASDEQLQLAAEALDGATERPPTQIEPDDLLRRISRAKSRLLTPRSMMRFARHDPLDGFVAGCYLRYQRALERANALDFDDLLLLAHRLFSEHPDVLAAYQERYQHVLVDEYQDTDPVQHALLEQLSRPPDGQRRPRSLFVVGDGMQAIYGFRNADYTIIARFTDDFSDARVFDLTTNYRSRQPILDAAYAVIRHSRSVPPMALQAAGAAPQHESCLFLQEARDSRDEAEHIARQIGDLLDSGRQEREVAILYRTRHMSRPLEAALRHAHIPYRVRGTTGFYDRAVIRDALAYLRAIANPADSLSLTRIANRPARGLGAQSLAALASFAAHNGLSLAAALGHPAALEQVSARAAQGARTLAGLLTRWQQFAQRAYPPDHLLADVLEHSGYSQMLEQRLAPEDLPDARAHLSELLEAAAEHTDLSSFLQEVALLTSSDEEDDERSRVELLTIHAAKGLEWPLVFVAGLEEGTLPHERSLPTAEGIEEERRLCYVALTRAAEKLFLSWAPGRSRGKTLQRSRFVEEIVAYGRERSQRA